MYQFYRDDPTNFQLQFSANVLRPKYDLAIQILEYAGRFFSISTSKDPKNEHLNPSTTIIEHCGNVGLNTSLLLILIVGKLLCFLMKKQNFYILAKKIPHKIPTFHIRGQPIQIQEEIKYLGIQLNTKTRDPLRTAMKTQIIAGNKVSIALQ